MVSTAQDIMDRYGIDQDFAASIESLGGRGGGKAGPPPPATHTGKKTRSTNQYVPAAMTLQRLMTTNPEMIDVLYAPALLPNRARLHIAVARIQDLVAFSSGCGPPAGFPKL